MTTRLDKRDVLDGLFSEWADLDQLLSGLSDEQWRAPTALPGWDVHAVVSHLIGTESMLQGVPTPAADGDMSELAHVRNDIGAMNECWVQHLRDEPPTSMLDRFHAITDERRGVLTSMGDDDWNAEARTPVGPDTYGRFMRIRTFDCWMHEQDIREAVSVWASDEVLAGQSAVQVFDEISAGLGYSVKKLGGAPDGSRIAFELTGPLQRTLRVAVDGRAQMVDDFGDAPPTSVVRLDAVLFTRLVGGRTTAAEHEDEIKLDGDADVGGRVVNNLKFVI